MASRTLPGLGLKGFWGNGFDGWDTEHDSNLRILSVLVQAKVLDRVAAEPGSPTNGDVYLLTGTGNVNKIVLRDNGAWVYIDPVEGYAVWVADENLIYRYDGAAWNPEIVSGAADFTDLADTPGTYVGHGGKLVRVNLAATALDYIDPLSLDSITTKKSVRTAIFTNVTIATALNVGDTIEAVVLADLDRVLLAGQTLPEENGIYDAGATPVRSSDYDSTAEVKDGSIVAVREGTHGGKMLMLTTNDPIVIGTTGLTYAQFGAGGGAFLDLSDVPGSFASSAKKKVRVNSVPDALEFVDDTRNVAGFFGGAIPVSGIVFAYMPAVPLNFPASLTGSVVKAKVAATAQTDFDLQKNGGSVGTIRFAIAGTVATYVSISAFSLAAGDLLEVVSPNPADATLEDLFFSFLAMAND